jgi:hypothetical protein
MQNLHYDGGMRNLVCVAALLLVAAPSLARERRGKQQPSDAARVATVDDEPTSHSAAEPTRTNAADPNATGSIRSGSQVSAPQVTSVAVRKEPARPTEHTVNVPPPPPVPEAKQYTKPSWLADLEEAHGRREMRPYQAALSGCTQRKLRREPDARGTLMLDVQVDEGSIAHAKVTEISGPDADDTKLKSCLEGIVDGKTFNAPGVHFTWTVKIFPRTNTTVAAEP